MCGIVGYIGEEEAAPTLIEGLRKLEYRGYDSAGVSILNGGPIQIRRSVGKLNELEQLLKKEPCHGHVGLGHTRWATHGEPSVCNAHPHMDASEQIAVVHNGIIENYAEIKQRLQEEGIVFKSETDTEVVAQLIGRHWRKKGNDFLEPSRDSFVRAVMEALSEIKGSYALGIMSACFPQFMVGVRRDCPLIIGLAQTGNMLASDVPAVLAKTRDVIYLNDGDVAIFEGKNLHITNEKNEVVRRSVATVEWDADQAEKGTYPHFMIKEIHEQPRAVKDTLAGHLKNGLPVIDDNVLSVEDALDVRQIHLLACGTSWHAGLIGSYWLEKWTGLPCQASAASEFRYRDTPIDKNTLVIAISQSGETADTLAAIKLAKNQGARVVAIANVVGSSLTREAHGSLLTRCGPEIGVASTKAFMGQLVMLYLFALELARLRKSMSGEKLKSLTAALAELPEKIERVVEQEETVRSIAEKYMNRPDFLYLGRHLNYPVALEGALKLKEISYLHAEGYPAGEMKHGPIALIGDKTPVVAIVTKSSVYEKMFSNMEEVRSRHADVIAVATENDSHAAQKSSDVIFVPDVPEEISPMVNVVPLQMLAYHIAVLRGCDVDKPRNLAKSVTVE